MTGHHRSWESQVKSGLVLAAVVVTVIILLLVLIGGLSIITGQAQGAEWQKNKLIGLAMVGFVATLLFVTADRWVGWFLGYNVLLAVKSFFVLVTGKYWTGPVPRLLALELLGLFMVIALLAYKFTERPPRTTFGRITLVGAFISASSLVISNSAKPLLLAVLFLLATHFSSRFLEKHVGTSGMKS